MHSLHVVHALEKIQTIKNMAAHEENLFVIWDKFFDFMTTPEPAMTFKPSRHAGVSPILDSACAVLLEQEGVSKHAKPKIASQLMLGGSDLCHGDFMLAGMLGCFMLFIQSGTGLIILNMPQGARACRFRLVSGARDSSDVIDG